MLRLRNNAGTMSLRLCSGLMMSISLLATYSWLVQAADNPEASRSLGATMIRSSSGDLYIFGGYSYEYGMGFHSGLSDKLFRLDEGRWVEVEVSSSSRPSARAFHTAVYDPSSNLMVIAGGTEHVTHTTSTTDYYFGTLCGMSDVWTFALNNNTWTKIVSDSSGCRTTNGRLISAAWRSVNIGMATIMLPAVLLMIALLL